MRSIGKAFGGNTDSEWLYSEAERVIREGRIPKERLAAIAEELGGLVKGSIRDGVEMAKGYGIGREAEMLGEIAAEYPLQKIKEIGADSDDIKVVKMACDTPKDIKSINIKV